jgi:hypothetical protein
LTEEFIYNNIQLGTAVAIILLFAGLMLMLQDVFGEKEVKSMGYEYVICDNGVWYPTGTDCKVALKKYDEYWHGIEEEVKQDERIKQVCDEVGGKMNKAGECETDHDGPIADAFHEKLLDKEQQEKQEEEQNDGWYGGPRDSEGNLIPFEDVPDSEYDNEDREPLKYEKAYREYLKKEHDMDLDGKEYWKIPREVKIDMEKRFEEQKEQEDEGKRYVNPDGGTPLYEDELTEEEKDDYEEYKPEKESETEIHNETPEIEVEDEEAVEEELEEIEEGENMDRSYNYEGEDESTETEEEEEFEEEEYEAEEEDDEETEENQVEEDDSGEE